MKIFIVLLILLLLGIVWYSNVKSWVKRFEEFEKDKNDKDNK